MDTLVKIMIVGFVIYVIYTEFNIRYIKRKDVPELYFKSKYISIMYLQKQLNILEKELDECKEGDTTFCLEYDIERLKDTIEFLEKF